MACINQRAANVVVEPLDLRLAEQHTGCLTADNTTDVAGQYIELSNADTDFYLWFDDSVASDPAPAGKTDLGPVSYDSTDSDSAFADSIVAAINASTATSDLVAKKVNDAGTFKVLIQCIDANAVNSDWALGTAVSLAIEIERTGSSLDLGLIQGEVTIGIEETFTDVTAAQFGPELLAQIRTANNFTLSVTLEEVQADKLSQILAFSSTEVTPSGGTAVQGYGALSGSKQFGNVIEDSKILIMHPTRNAADDLSGDYAFWRAYPTVSEILHSGEEVKTATVDFSFFIDEARRNDSNKLVYGNWQQDFIND